MIMWNVLVYAVIGLFAGAATRLAYPGRQPKSIVGTLALGAAGALASGLISWAVWPEVDGQFHTGNLVVSVLGAFTVILLWAGVSYARKLRGPRAV